MIAALGPHGGYILASYAAAVLVLGTLTLAILRDRRVQRRALAALEERGAGRRPARGATP